MITIYGLFNYLCINRVNCLACVNINQGAQASILQFLEDKMYPSKTEVAYTWLEDNLRFVGNDTHVVINSQSNKSYLARLPVNHCFSRCFTSYVNLIRETTSFLPGTALRVFSYESRSYVY